MVLDGFDADSLLPYCSKGHSVEKDILTDDANLLLVSCETLLSQDCCIPTIGRA